MEAKIIAKAKKKKVLLDYFAESHWQSASWHLH